MKQHLNTLFVTTEGTYLAKDGMAVAVRMEKKTRLRIPLHNLDGIVCFGRVGVSPSLMAICGESGVTISMTDAHGRFRAAIIGYSPGNVLLRRTQYRVADDPSKSCEIARIMVAAKLANCRAVLLRAARDSRVESRRSTLTTAARRLVTNLEAARACDSLERLRGIEGEGASTYFEAFSAMVNVPEDAFQFTSRSRRPPLDPLNALLSFLYALLAHDARSACEAAGLDAAVGFLHRDRPGRPGLALDLMEEFRPFLADRLALSLINRRQISASGFTTSPTGAVNMNDATRKTLLKAYQVRKQKTMLHPFLQEKTSVGIMIHLQARLLARHLRGDVDAYPAFVWR
ncbi:type I-C CRISPR-associated endonuclease Cas1 [Bremerella cremea]|uniref:CRISPR-associated endonuclease Cas1 n=1 Tax=Blastopirellula marina TaxID=124 RepID=A0A2S8FDI7_9BACT|nr:MULTISPECIES: type I-C CRISPR-associated endonuclease Cas1c [Pirellulaceae]PQO30216.1 subtype I-C CRISPR-associated endonuclease Cas1 [Blastopirellula marina]RCS43567.1 type I-C CRISPR-associated endonuclease Cas1 [Bremerella cremea]